MQIGNANIPFIAGLGLLERNEMVLNIVHDILECYNLECQIPFTRKRNHTYFEWVESQETIYAFAEVKVLHSNVSHYCSDKLNSLLKLAKPWETNREAKNVLEAINCRRAAF